MNENFPYGMTEYKFERLMPPTLITTEENDQRNKYFIDELIARLYERYRYTLEMTPRGKTLFAKLEGKECLLSISRSANTQNRSIPSATFVVQKDLLLEVEYYICLDRVCRQQRRDFLFPVSVLMKGANERTKVIPVCIPLRWSLPKSKRRQARIDFFAFEDQWEKQLGPALVI